jgi:mRNA interferase MazF
MKRGDLYRVHHGTKYDPKNYRVFVIVGRHETIHSAFSSVICAPIFSNYNGSVTQLAIGIEEGLKHNSAIVCDNLTSIPKSLLTDYVGKLSVKKLDALKLCLLAALEIEEIRE